MSSPTDVPVHPAAPVPAAATHGARRRRVALLILALLVGVAGIVSIFTSSYHAFIDLDVYRLGVRQWLNGGDLYGSLPPTYVGIRLPFIYPPFAAIALSPLALISWGMAGVLNFGISIAALAVTGYLAVRRLWPACGRQGALVVSGFALPLAVWVEPVRETIGFGQVNLVLMVLVAADCLVEKPRWPRGLLVGVAAAIKLTPAILLLYFLIRRDLRATVVTIVSGAVATVIGFVVLPSESVRYWFGGFAGAASLSGSPYATNQTIKAALVRLSLPQPVESGLWLLIAAVVLVAAAVGVWRAFGRSNIVLAMVVTSAAGLLL
ncbi:MAG: glycosyltransferase 87 family protein, partial [Sciscionella sp.]